MFFIGLLVVWVSAIFFCPILFRLNIKGKNAINTGLFIVVRKDLGEHARYIFAQELYESRLKITKPFYLASRPLHWIGFSGLLQAMELAGHEVEVQAGSIFDENFDENSYRLKEASVLTRKYSEFEGWSVPEVEDAMIEMRGLARAWVLKNKSKLTKFRP